MKKFIALFGFMAIFLAGNFSAHAQTVKKADKKTIMANAEKHTSNLAELTGLSTEQKTKVVKLFYLLEDGRAVIATDEKAKPRLPILNEQFTKQLKTVLDEKQFKIFTENKKRFGFKE